ncbi:tRNA (adenosine(37)-N6)-threonylcarbamoyltransferase complex dimerization subunit type 1 TsaB [Maribacter algarum]|uniref:tRNA (Adenosine(37)-N6)-threonylcarbamoyltransferase complex dimerization subunit type 1 TsaB n=1 Tax=Maribacter algarum (ex Zhang et al. 2020) TaxID=2578118 RepID=A0A5S3PTC6_9FLAO|nr:tRNA (adenosine(37)-N6)-threonylcarbamoyltransferase complex dimerization subunit type 1 TsaB [Maribacter algarum]TMM58246.1 tRNA (adenosine(37)-N6)-threonylcarbamoyltransferase complex dimerization subunit type 1 TsaB [Maribacter algarum]
MALILNLETATTNCSVSVAKEGKTIAIKEHDTPNYSHSEQLHVFIQEVLKEASISLSNLDAIAISKGPGSYTGLRIGVSAAKGLCFSLDVPLISVETLESLAYQEKSQAFDFLIPVLDARRMEVYSKVFDNLLNEIRETKAEIIDANSFSSFLNQGKVLLLGSGASKCQEVLKNENLSIADEHVPSAEQLSQLSFEKYQNRDFEDVAYFEPYYLKDFILQTKAKK